MRWEKSYIEINVCAGGNSSYVIASMFFFCLVKARCVRTKHRKQIVACVGPAVVLRTKNCVLTFSKETSINLQVMCECGSDICSLYMHCNAKHALL